MWTASQRGGQGRTGATPWVSILYSPGPRPRPWGACGGGTSSGSEIGLSSWPRAASGGTRSVPSCWTCQLWWVWHSPLQSRAGQWWGPGRCGIKNSQEQAEAGGCPPGPGRRACADYRRGSCGCSFWASSSIESHQNHCWSITRVCRTPGWQTSWNALPHSSTSGLRLMGTNGRLSGHALTPSRVWGQGGTSCLLHIHHQGGRAEEKLVLDLPFGSPPLGTAWTVCPACRTWTQGGKRGRN